MSEAPRRQPTVFLPHGGGPWPFVEMGLDKRETSALTAYLRSVASLPTTAPRAVLVVSAHWEEAVPTVMTHPNPPLLFDYYGFPEASYHLTWPAPGSPAVAQRVRDLLAAAGIPSGADPARGFDHGTFVPLKLLWPDATIPTVQLSLKQGLDPQEHLAIGRALAPLRDEGVFIIGSGMSFHNLRALGDPRAKDVSQLFDAWLQTVGTLPQPERDARLAAWSTAPAARQSHPREEHLIPMLVVAGAAGADQGRVGWSGELMGWQLSAYHYGEV